MIGLILTGHGHFASGLLSSLQLIVGPTEKIIAVDFLSEDSIDDLKAKFETAFKKLKDCKGVIFLTDLLGGSPFKEAVLFSVKYDMCKVVYGTNLPLLLEAHIKRNEIVNIDQLIESIISTTKGQIGYFKFDDEITETEDGI